MAASRLTIEEIYEYFKENGNVVKNRDLVHYFRDYLTDQQSKEDARVKFKKYVNILAQTKTENNDKFLVLKTKYLYSIDSLKTSQMRTSSPQNDPRNSIGIPSTSYSNSPSSQSVTGQRQPPPYRPPPPVSSPSCSDDNISIASNFSQDFSIPQPPPRRKSSGSSSSDKSRPPLGEMQQNFERREEEVEEKLTLSVKERRDKFNRLASHEEENSPRPPKSAEKNKIDKGGDQDDGASIASLEPKKCMEWCVTASKGDFQELLKLAKDEPRLVNRKDPFTAYTVLHWGAKHGNAEIIKVFAGTYKVDVNGKTNGGYTPLHMAAQFGHKDIFKLLIEVYKADPKIRDYSGHTPEYYLKSREQKGRKDTIRKIKNRKKQTDKELGFLRIGSLNVRVKKTTEAFSNFLGVGGNVTPLETMLEKPQKGWGSAENLDQRNCDGKRKFKRPISTGISSIPGTPQQRIRETNTKYMASNDSDSDSAAGFDSQWKH